MVENTNLKEAELRRLHLGINRFKKAFLVHNCTKNLDIRKDNLRFYCLF